MKETGKQCDLTKTEARVLELLLAGKSNKEISGILHRSIRTVEGRRYRIMHKFGAVNVTDLIKKVWASKCPQETRITNQGARKAEIKPKSFTNIEKTVLKLILQGKTSRQISEKLNRSLRTIEEHRRRIMQKIGADDIIGLVKSSIQMGLISFETPNGKMAKKE